MNDIDHMRWQNWRLALIVVLPFTIAVTLGVVAILLPSSGVTKANFDRIKEGMTRKEAEEVFGKEGTTVFDTGQVQLVRWEASDGSRAEIDFVDGIPSKIRWIDSGETSRDAIRRWLHIGPERPKLPMRTGP